MFLACITGEGWLWPYKVNIMPVDFKSQLMQDGKTTGEQGAVTDLVQKFCMGLMFSGKDVPELVCSFMPVVLPTNFTFKSLSHELLNWLMYPTSSRIFLSTCILERISISCLLCMNLSSTFSTNIFFK
jgi:hypothetical protein